MGKVMVAKSIHLSWNKVVDFISLYNFTSATVTSQHFYEEHFFKTWPKTTPGESTRDSVNRVVLLCVFVCFLLLVLFSFPQWLCCQNNPYSSRVIQLINLLNVLVSSTLFCILHKFFGDLFNLADCWYDIFLFEQQRQ